MIYGDNLLGSLGNKLANRTFGSPSQFATMRSNPNAPPACGEVAYWNDST